MNYKKLESNILKVLSGKNAEMIFSIFFIFDILKQHPLNMVIKSTIIISIFVILIFLKKNNYCNIFDVTTIAIFMLNIIIFLILFESNLDFIFVSIGLLLICLKVFFSKFISKTGNMKISLFIIEFSIFYFLIISQKIIYILNILE